VPCQRLLAEHVLACPQGTDRPLDVEGVWQRDVDGVDLRILEQLLVRAVRALESVLAGVLQCPRPLATRDRDHLKAARFPRPRQDEVIDAGGREDPPADYHRRRAY